MIFSGAACAIAYAQPQLQISDGPAIAGPTFRFVAGNLIGGNVVKGAPYSAEAVTDMTQTLADGTHIVQHSTATEYRDSEGRERREQTLSNLGGLTAQSTPVQAIFISDPVAGVNYSLNPMDHTAMKLPQPPVLPSGTSGPNVIYRQMTVQGSGPGVVTLPAQAGAIGAAMIAGPGPNATFIHREMIATAGASSDPSLPAPNVEQLGSKTIAGVSAMGTRTTITIPAGQIGNDAPLTITDERWYSPDLQVTVQSTHSDPRVGATTYSLQNVSLAEPSPAFFQVPADYTVTDPPRPAKIVAP
jgi:hypothetical protein